ncbi:MAG: LptF/LptG family permease [Planctomycetaceae bacterium]|nr:LptF/LptG family permease [Planctomycetaceae bacterium]
MKLFLRYIIFDILKIFVTVLALMTAVLTLVFVVKTAMDEGLPFNHAIYLIPYLMPEQLRFSIPMTLLLAATVSFSRMAGSNEIVATKSLGISPWRLLWPVWILALIFSFVCVWLNDFAVTWGRSGLTQVVFLSLEDVIYSKLQTDGSYSYLTKDNTVKISVDRVVDRTLMDVVVTSKKDELTVQASEAELNVDFNANKLYVSLRNIHATGKDMGSLNIAQKTFEYPLPQPSKELENTSPSDIPLGAIEDQSEKCMAKIDLIRRKTAATTAFSFLTGENGMSDNNTANLQEYHAQLKSLDERLHRLNTEPTRRWAAGFSCFFFVWIGAPLAIRLQKADVFASFFVCFLPILIIYYPFLMYGITSAKNGTLPPAIVWVGNICLGAIGYGILKQIHKN